MRGLVLAASLLAATPLIGGIVLASAALERLAKQSETLLRDGVSTTRQGVRLRDQFIDLERNARQYVVLRDPALLEVFAARADTAAQTLRTLQEGGYGGLDQDRLQAMALRLDQVHRQWPQASPEGGDAQAVVSILNGLSRDASTLLANGEASLDREIESLRAEGRRARWTIYLATGALIPLAVLLSIGLTAVVVRPLRQAEKAISALGHTDYGLPIRIGFPREMEELGQQLDWLRQRLAQLESDKDRFLRHVTHELKTPLASLREGASLLGDGSLGALNPAQTEVVRILDEAARELEDMVVNLLAYAEWRSARELEARRWFPLQPILEGIARSRQLQLDARDLRLELPAEAVALWGQPRRWQEVLDNLIGNAIKHSPEGCPIRIEAQSGPEGCVLRVRDQGRGIPDGLLSTIFEPFVRGDVAEESRIRGTGIGLAIVREAVVDHHGSIEVENAQPGAVFTLRWPGPDAGGMRELAP